MIKLMTSCTDCMHSKMCKYKSNVESDFNKLKKTTYDSGLNDDYDWETMSERRNVEIRFACPDYTTKGVTFR